MDIYCRYNSIKKAGSLGTRLRLLLFALEYEMENSMALANKPANKQHKPVLQRGGYPRGGGGRGGGSNNSRQDTPQGCQVVR